ncbi:MAG: phenylalanine--tRNA ligase subunit beta [Ruminococcaceae bacterium]|nr:phenylalanine--tRNA ligase subunit beta [Oscillospiraceae bacterium]
MLFSMNWIGDFVDLSELDIPALIHRFTLSTAEVEDIYVKGRDVRGVVVARILSVKKHPSSDHLHLLRVDTGSGIVDCVCGAPNVREGLTVAFATVGGTVPGKDGTPMEIAARKVAGHPSMGMCCSEAELGVSDDNSGLWVLPDNIPLGTDIKAIYPIDDIVFEVDNKSLTNRPDLWGHYGVAREFAAITGRPLLDVGKKDLTAYDYLPPVEIDIRDTRHAYRYIGTKVENITVHESPMTMKIRLYYCGSRAINLLADLTNYVMMELGQPMHAFDLKKVDKIEVQRFASPFEFTTLDHEVRTIDDRVLMICSNEEPVAIAGIKGGLASGISEETNSLLLESATFDGVCIRHAGTYLGLRTDASMRYEKMLDPALAPLATARFLYLLSEIDAGITVVSAVTDKYVYEYPTIEIDIDKAYYDRYTGIDIPTKFIVKTLRALGFGVLQNGDSFHVTVPSWRATKDVSIKADLIEEVTRIYGYDNFEVKTSKSPLYPVRPDTGRVADNRVKDILVSTYKMHEVHSYIWCDETRYRDMGIALPQNPKIINAQTPEHATLRYSMIPTLLSFLADNRGYAPRYGIFEIGRTVHGYNAEGMCDEHKMLGFALLDKTKSEEEVFLTARDAVVAIFRAIKHVTPVFVALDTPLDFMHPANAYAITVDGVCYGTLSVLHPSVKSKLDRKASVAFAEMDMALFASLEPKSIKYTVPSRFPTIEIDFSFLVDPAAVNFDALCALCHSVGGDLLSDISLVDVYESNDGNSSIALRFVFCAPDRTLTRAELAPHTDAILAALSEQGLALKEA